MRAAVVDRYGPPEVIRVTDVPTPAPKAGEVLVRVRAVAVTSADARIRAASFPAGFGLPGRLAFGLTRPRRPILGSSFSGVVEVGGGGGAGLEAGEEVCGMTGIRLGAHAEYVAVPAGKVVLKPAGVSAEDAAGLLFGGSTALHFLRDKARVTTGQSVLVNGASGAVGSCAVQLARHFGAEVTGVTSAANTALVASLGAGRVIDYTTQELSTLPGRFDVVLDTVGNLSIPAGRRLLAPGGMLALAVAGLAETLRARGKVVAGPAPERADGFAFLLGLLAAGDLRVVNGGHYDLDHIADAHRRVDTGHKVGNLVVQM